ncbi:hypothetical protein DPMN_138702 [Dreissena polymorpha]|uniref:VWFD domain-containing protein n=1 Tax=Dreissena polymorpha TaxID=45954 RepID=A0A9D4G4Z3_DREPO|nr:hypothetical protein DPMN_138702 [Dreissena polymorpha]
MGHNMNVYVYPSVADFMKTSGLCGSFDGTTTNDRLNRPGFNDPDPNKSWMYVNKQSRIEKQALCVTSVLAT